MIFAIDVYDFEEKGKKVKCAKIFFLSNDFDCSCKKGLLPTCFYLKDLDLLNKIPEVPGIYDVSLEQIGGFGNEEIIFSDIIFVDKFDFDFLNK
ncbi:hypothetical protein WG909_15190 (plasmid) [Peptostreptococcaceae bacterium AGR-M142]